MDTESTSMKPRWETPATVALTETESRADQRDTALRNGSDSALSPN